MKLVNGNLFLRIGGTRTSDTSASLCYPEELKANIPLSEPQIIQIRAVNYDGKPQQTGGDPFTATLQAPDGTSTLHCYISDNGDGTYKLNFTADAPGTHHLDVRVFGRGIRGSPFQITVQQDTDADVDKNHEFDVYIPDVALVGYPQKILVNVSKEQTDVAKVEANTIHATIETQTGDSVKCTSRVINAESGQYAIQYTPPVDGPLNAIITVNKIPAAGNPYVIHVQPASPKACKVTLGRPVAHQFWSICVSPRDYRQSPISIDQDAIQVKVTNDTDNTALAMTCRKNKDGDFVFTCIPTAGTHSVKAFLYDIPITEEHIDIPKFVEELVSRERSSKSFPTSIATSFGNSLFISDTVDNNIYRYGVNLQQESNVPVDMNKSSEIAIDDQGRLLLLFPQTRMVHTIDQQGNELSRWPCQKKNSRPVTIIASREGRVIIADSKIPSMYIYKSDGDLINMQELPEKSIKDGVNNICVDKRSSIIIAHHSLPKIFTHNSDGKPLGQFSSGATSYQLAATCTDEDVLLVAQLGTIRMIHFSGDQANFIGEIPLETGHIFTGLVSTTDGCLVGLDVGYKRLVKYGYKVKR